MISKIIRSKYYLVFLAFLVPYLFFVGNNYHIYSLYFSIISIISLSCYLAIFIFFLFLLDKFINFLSIKFKLKWLAKLYDFLILIFSASILCLFLKFNINRSLISINLNYKFIKIIVLLCFIIIFIYLKYCQKNIFIVNIFLTVWLFFILLFSLYNIISDNSLFEQDNKFNNDINITFKEKPNVYFFLMESFQPLDRVNRIFNIDTKEFYIYLKVNNFTVYNSIFANSSSTLYTINDILTFKPIPSKDIKTYSDVSNNVRKIISGNNSIVYDTFKANGYMIELFVPIDYINRTMFNLDKINHNISANIYLTSPITIISDLLWLSGKYTYKELEDSLLERINADTAKPRFMFIKFIGALHTPTYNYNWQSAPSWIKSGIYQDEYLKAIKSIEFACDQIINNDPNAWIILMGDHGPGLYKDIFDSKIVMQEQIEQISQENNISLDELVEDTFSVFLAIRTSKDNKDISKSYILDPRTLFLHVFAELSDDKNLLKMRFPVFSSFPASQMTPLIDGKLNPNWFDNPYLSDVPEPSANP
jgi:hypothetical protein